MTTKKTTNARAPQKSVAKPAKAPKARAYARGNITPEERAPLLIAAQDAFKKQQEYGLIDDGEKFDTWRRAQVMAAVSKPGISALDHGHWIPVMVHFLILAGRDAEAFQLQLKTGRVKDHGHIQDTHENRATRAYQIRAILEAHIYVAEHSVEEIQAGLDRAWAAQNPGVPQAEAVSLWLSKLIARKAAIAANPKGAIRAAYVVTIARGKTKRPDLTLGPDLEAALRERCTADQLEQIRDTLENRINAREGVGSAKTRNKSQRSKKSKEARSPGSLAPRWKSGMDETA